MRCIVRLLLFPLSVISNNTRVLQIMSGTPNYEPVSDRSGIAFKPSGTVRTRTVRAVPTAGRRAVRDIWPGGLAALAWLASAALTQWWPDADDWPYTHHLLVLKLALAVVAVLIGVSAYAGFST